MSIVRQLQLPVGVPGKSDTEIRVDADVKLFIRAALSEYARYITDDSSDIGSLISHAIGWELMSINKIVYSDQATDLTLKSTRESIQGDILGFTQKIFAKMPDVVRRFTATLTNNTEKCFVKAAGLQRAGGDKGSISIGELESLEPLTFTEEDWKIAAKDEKKDDLHVKFRRMRKSVDSELIPNTPNLSDAGDTRGELTRMLKKIRNLLLALYAVSLTEDSQYHIQRPILAIDKLPIMPELEASNRKTPIFELLSMTTHGDKAFTSKIGKYTNEAFTFFYGYYAACIRRGISAQGNTMNVDDLLISNVFLVLHLCYVMSSDPIIQVSLTPPPPKAESHPIVRPTQDILDFSKLQGVDGKTAEVFRFFCATPSNNIELYTNMKHLWATGLANASFMDKGAKAFLEYGKFRKHHTKILRQASRDVFERKWEDRIINSDYKMIFNDQHWDETTLKLMWDTMPAHAKYVNYDEVAKKVRIPSGDFVGALGGNTQRRLKEESVEEFINGLDESINMFDVERICQYLADKMSGIFDLSKKSTRDTIGPEFEVAGDMGIRKFSAIIEDKFQFIRDDIVNGPRRDLLSILNIVNDYEFVGEMLEGLLSSDTKSWNYLNSESNAKMRLFAVVMCDAPPGIYQEFHDIAKEGVVYDMDYYKVIYMLNSVVSISANAEGMKYGNAGLPANTQVDTLRFIEDWSRKVSRDPQLQYNPKETPTQKLRKIVLFLNLLAVELVRTDNSDGSSRPARVLYSTERQIDRMTFGSFMVRRLLLKWLSRNVIRLMGFCPSDSSSVFPADEAIRIIYGSGTLFGPLRHDLMNLKLDDKSMIVHVPGYLPDESIKGVHIGHLESFTLDDFEEAPSAVN